MIITSPLPDLATPEAATAIIIGMAVLVFLSSPYSIPNTYTATIEGNASMARGSDTVEPILQTIQSTVLDNGSEGNLELVEPEPVLEGERRPQDQIDVFVNFRIARQPEGYNAIRVFLPEGGVITASQAHWLHIDLDAASQAVSNVRTALGYEV